MFPKGVIYKKGFPSYGVKYLRPSALVRFFYQTARGFGAGIVAYAIIFLIFTYGPLVNQEWTYRLSQGKSEDNYESLLDKAKADSIAEVQKEAHELGVSPYFSIVIPKINASENIVANVDAADEKSYLSALEEGVAHAKGTYFPGQGNRIYLFSHSTNSPLNFARYNAVFYLLKKLEKGDMIVIFFADKKYIYEVSDKKVVGASDTSWLTGVSSGEELVLQTCDPPGTTWNRFVVVAKPLTPYGGR